MSGKKPALFLVIRMVTSPTLLTLDPLLWNALLSKLFTSCLPYSMFAFLSANGYIEHRIQKGFMPKLSGTFEHTAHKAHIINKARMKQRSVMITLLDLKNSFGEVHHNLIPTILKYHHIPDQLQQLINNLYSNFHTSVLSDCFRTPFINVSRGILQGDSLRPVTFNLCFNTFIRYIADQKFKQFGFPLNTLYPTHCFQLADDAAVIPGLENENQILLNHFTRWFNWSGIKIRVGKCITFGIKQSAISSVQFLPKLIINNSLLPNVERNNSFKYLGRFFDYSMNNSDHMSALISTINDLMTKIDCLPCHPKSKLLPYHRFSPSKLSWHLTIADLIKTWAIDNLDSIVIGYVRK